MKSTALQQLETLLHTRKLGGILTTGQESESATAGVAPSGLPALDARLGGGWPHGSLSELVGPRSSGRTRALVSTLARATRDRQLVALVDGFDRFDPRVAAEAGLDLDRVLWVRGAPITVEQARPSVLDRSVRSAVRAFDLVLRADGFAVVVLDLAEAPAVVLRRLPVATWLRLARVNEGRATVGLLMGQVPMGRSAHGISVRCEAVPVWTGASAQSRRLTGFETTYTVQAARLRPVPLHEPLEDCG